MGGQYLHCDPIEGAQAMRRWSLRCKNLMIQTPFDDTGWLFLDNLRKTMPKHFRYGRIAEGFQMNPDKLPVGVVCDVSTGQIIGEPWKL